MTTRYRISQRQIAWYVAALGMLLILTALGSSTEAQRSATQGGALATTGKASALVDMTGYWVSIVDEDWLYRMMTPAKGDRASVPLNVEGERVTDAWDPQKDKANGDECKAYGAGNIMRIPERLHISWANDNTLQMEIDAGMQKRLFHFDGPKWQGGKLQRQGDSVAAWEKQIQRRAGNPFGGPEPGKGGKLRVVTMHMQPGYLQKNGIPYSENAVLTEYYTVVTAYGNTYLVLTSVVTDPEYLTSPYVLSSQFKHEADGSKWDPSPCRPLWPLSGRFKWGLGRSLSLTE